MTLAVDVLDQFDNYVQLNHRDWMHGAPTDQFSDGDHVATKARTTGRWVDESTRRIATPLDEMWTLSSGRMIDREPLLCSEPLWESETDDD